MNQSDKEWLGKEYEVWYLNGGFFSVSAMKGAVPNRVAGTLINFTEPFVGQIMIEDEEKHLHIIPFRSIVLMKKK